MMVFYAMLLVAGLRQEPIRITNAPRCPALCVIELERVVTLGSEADPTSPAISSSPWPGRGSGRRSSRRSWAGQV